MRSLEKGKNYAAFRPCGCFCAVAYVRRGDKKIAENVSKWISDGLDVRQVTNEDVWNSKGKWGCLICKPPKADKQTSLNLTTPGHEPKERVK